MAKLHNDGELIKADDDGKDHTYIFNELDEQNTVGTGASISTGNSPAYATPKAFGKKKDKTLKEETDYEAGMRYMQGDRDTTAVTAYEKGNEKKEKEFSRDVKVIEKIIRNTIKDADEWEEMLELLIDHSKDISTLNTSAIRGILQQLMKEL